MKRLSKNPWGFHSLTTEGELACLMKKVMDASFYLRAHGKTMKSSIGRTFSLSEALKYHTSARDMQHHEA